jgi:hypothetical protein
MSIHEGMVQSVLGQGSSTAVLVHSPYPSPQYYFIERIFRSRARIRNQKCELPAEREPALDAMQRDLLRQIKAAGDAVEAATAESGERTYGDRDIWTPLQKTAVETYQTTLRS